MKAVKLTAFFWTFVVCLPFRVHAQQAGALDRTFKAGAGASDDVLTAAVLPQGGQLLGGYFTSFNGLERWRVAHLLADGALDPKFDAGESSGAAAVSQVTALPNGSVFVAGSFTRFGGFPRPLVARLRKDGSVDPTFDATSAFAGVAGRVNVLTMLLGDKLMVGGRFDPSAEQRQTVGTLLVRLLPTGQMDPSFHGKLMPVSREDQLNALTVLSDGKFLAGTHSGVIRLQADGNRDGGFRPPETASSEAMALAVQSDGKIVVASRISSGWRVARLMADGQPDSTFHVQQAVGETAGIVHVLALSPDGKILLGGSFREVDGVRRHGLARLNGDGTLDRGFDPGTGVEVISLEEADETPEAAVRVVLPLQEGSILVAGRFDLYNGVSCHNVAKIFDGGPVSAATTPAK